MGSTAAHGVPSDLLQVGLAQIAPVWLDRAQTTSKRVRYARPDMTRLTVNRERQSTLTALASLDGRGFEHEMCV